MPVGKPLNEIWNTSKILTCLKEQVVKKLAIGKFYKINGLERKVSLNEASDSPDSYRERNEKVYSKYKE